MLLLTLTICGVLSSFNCAASFGNGWSSRPQWELRQRFLLDLLLQVHKPLLQQELIEMGRELNESPIDYETGGWPLLRDFFERVHQGRILRPYSIYNLLQEELPDQLLGVYRFLVLAKDWKTFQRNACFARSRFNPVLFVHALQMAIGERADAKDLMMPAMHEVLPQLYFDKELIREAQLVNWQQLAPISLRRSWRETLGSIVYPKIFRQPTESEPMPTDPVVLKVRSLETQLSLDVVLNGYWSRLISHLIIATKANEDAAPAIIKGDRWVAFRNDQDEKQGASALIPEKNHLLIHSIKQFVALVQLEELATGTSAMHLAEPTLMTTGGVPYRPTALNIPSVQHLISKTVEELRQQIHKQLESDQKMLPVCTVGQVLATQYWQICRNLSLAINGNRTQPNLLGMTTSNLRDPIYRLLLVNLAQLMAQYESAPSSEAGQRLQVSRIRVGPLETFEQLVDTDLINLIDQQLLQTQRNNLQLLRRRLVARHLRLNHKPFNITFELSALVTMAALIRLESGNLLGYLTFFTCKPIFLF